MTGQHLESSTGGVKSADFTIGTIPKNKRDSLRVAFTEFKGVRYLSVRTWYVDAADGIEKPSPRGCNIPLDRIGDFCAADRRGDRRRPAPGMDPVSDPGWERAYPKWIAFRKLICDEAWLAWFADAELESETVLCVPSKFVAEEIGARFAAQLAEHFGVGVEVRFGRAA